MAKKLSLKIIAASFWLMITLALAGWWLIFGLRQVDQISQLKHSLAHEIARHQRMLVWEGSILLLLLLGGGLALLYYINLEKNRSREIKEFFATFSHEVKTAIASLRLQAESLQEDLSNLDSPLLRRLIKDTVRLELQMENSLFLANDASSRLHIENLSLKKAIANFHHHWPDVDIELKKDVSVKADARALESVLKNLIQNSVTHGRAKKIEIEMNDLKNGRVEILLKDNGQGLKGESKQLGQLFYRHYPGSGSGLGLHIVKRLMRQMDGEVSFFENDKKGFCTRLIFLGEVK